MSNNEIQQGSILFSCSNCGRLVAMEDYKFNQPVSCGHCDAVTTVPAGPLAPRRVLNEDFVLRDEIGHGGVGRVFKAHQLSLDRPVAMKVLMEQFSSDTEFIEDFIKEARAAARLNHPNIVQSYAVGEDHGYYFCAMEFIDGETLKDVLTREGRLNYKRATEIMLQISEGLDFAWQNQELVHRDIKPDNIMITTKGVAKLADLGLARVATDLQDDDTDEIMGTPQYICPEQLIGASMDIRGDIYSLGATFFHIITDRFPFEGTTAAEIARKHLQQELISPRKIIPDIPKEVCFIIEKMMAKHPDDRYKDPEELIQDLSLIKSGKLSSPKTSSSHSKKKKHTSSHKKQDIRKTTKSRMKIGGSTKSKEEESPPVDTSSEDHGGPSEVDSISTDTKTAKKTKNRLKTRKGGKTKLSFKGGTKTKISVSDHSQQDISSDNTATKMENRKNKKMEEIQASRKRFNLIVGVVALVIIVASIFLVFYIIKMNRTPEEIEIDKLEEMGYANFRIAKYLTIKHMAQQETKNLLAYKDIFKKIRDYREDYPKKDTLITKMYTVAQPYNESEWQSQRKESHKKEQKILSIVTSKRKAAERKRSLQAERKLKIAEQERLKAEREAAREREKEEHRAELAKRQKELRWEKYDLCKEYKLGEAKKLFLKMSLDKDYSEYASWAENERSALDVALKAYKLVWNSKQRLKNLKYRYKRKYWKIRYISRKTMSLQQVDLGGNYKLDDKKKRIEVDIPLTSLSPSEILKLSVKPDPGMIDLPEFSYNFGAFLFCIGSYRKAVEFLNKSGMTGIQHMLDEIEIMKPEMNIRKWQEGFDKITLLLEEGAYKEAKYRMKILSSNYPEQYKENQTAVQQLFQQ
ncbi:MAG: serine/threonine-protein kinase [Verrucomicrobiota bacterium]|nr:serine/threonine-protein kinase [Verrucomicrobiota bacterium]